MPKCLGLNVAQQHTLRADLLQAARSWTHQLSEIAIRVGIGAIEIPAPATPPHQSPTVVVATGHQPHVFHCGTIFKYEMTAQFAAEQHGAAISIIMDTDRGDAGRFAFPTVAPGKKADVGGLGYATLATPPSLFLNARIANANQIESVGRQVGDALNSLGKDAADRSFCAAMQTFSRLAGYPAGEAHSIARRTMGMADQLWELPLSRLCQVAGFRSAMMHVVRDAANFHTCYNETLEQWRQRRRIRNRLNPFPTLKRRGSCFELPLWAIDVQHDERLPIWAEAKVNGVRLFAGERSLGSLTELATAWPAESDRYLIAPRAALISMLFRTLCSDFFLHGLRGSSYDAFTDRLIANYCGIKPPQYGVVSMSRYLFADEHQRVKVARAHFQQNHFWQHHPERLLKSGKLAPDEARIVAAIVERKSQLLQQIAQRSHSIRPTRPEHLALAAMRADVARVLDAGRFQLRVQTDWDREASEAISCRTYPWFFHRTDL